MTLALGATFPLALRSPAARLASRTVSRRRRRSTVGRDAARVYTANTIGAIAGALVGGLRADPRARPAPDLRDRRRSSARSAARHAWPRHCATRLERRTQNESSERERRTTNHERLSRARRSRSAFAVLRSSSPAAVAVTVRRGDPATAPLGSRAARRAAPTAYAPYLGTDNFETVLRAGTLRLLQGRRGGDRQRAAADRARRSLAIDGKVDASNAGDMLTQRMLGLLPRAASTAKPTRRLHHRPRQRRDARLRPAVRSGRARRRRRDFSPEVVEASHFFDRENGGALGETARPPRSSATGDPTCC